MGKTVYLVARSLKAARGACEVLLGVLLSPESKIGATDSNIPTRTPWQKVATDLLEWRKHTYLVIVDYYFRLIEIAQLKRTMAEEVIVHTKSIFARHGVPEIVVSDNGPQYSSEAYAKFAQEFQFEHITSSPHYPQSNGESECAVKTVKSLLKKEGDPYLDLMSYRATPLQNGFSPSGLLISRRLRTTVPMTRELLRPQVPDSKSLRERNERLKTRQQRNFDHHHGVRELTPTISSHALQQSRV